MGRSSRRKKQRRSDPSGQRPLADRGDAWPAAVRDVHVDHAKGTLIGDHGTQINYFQHVAAGSDGGGLQPVQADLPAESRVFTGRDADLAELLALLDPQAPGTEPRIAVVSGMAGVGKSELVLHAAHAAAANGWFPGGVLFVTLRGDDLELAQIALDGFLAAVGIPGDRVSCRFAGALAAVFVCCREVRRGQANPFLSWSTTRKLLRSASCCCPLGAGQWSRRGTSLRSSMPAFSGWEPSVTRQARNCLPGSSVCP